MTSVQSFGSSLLTPQVKSGENPQNVSVEDILNNTPAPIPEQVSDTFTKSGTSQSSQPTKSSSLLWKFIGGATVIVGAFFAARAGWFRKINGWFGGKHSTKDLNKKFQEKMAEYLNVGEKGKVEIIKNDDGTSTLKATFASKQVREYSIKEGSNVVKLKGKFPDCELNEEVIVFDKKTGSPRFRVNLSRMDNGKVKKYKSYKGGDILDKNFDDRTGVFKEYSKGDESRNCLQFIDPETGNGRLCERVAFYDKTGKLEKINMAKEGMERTIHIGENGKVSSIRTETQDGKVTIKKFQYKTTPEGKIKKDKVEITDEKGNPTAPIKWNN